MNLDDLLARVAPHQTYTEKNHHYAMPVRGGHTIIAGDIPLFTLSKHDGWRYYHLAQKDTTYSRLKAWWGFRKTKNAYPDRKWRGVYVAPQKVRRL